MMGTLFLLVGLLPLADDGYDLGWLAEFDEGSEQTSIPIVYDLNLYTAYTLEGGAPETNLEQDPELGLWQIDGLLRPREAQGYPSFGLSFALEWELIHWCYLKGMLDTGEIQKGSTVWPPLDGVVSNANPIQDEFVSGSFVRELSTTFSFRGVAVEVGRFRSQIASGLVYDDFGTGVSARFDFDEAELGPWRSELSAITVGRRFEDMVSPSPLFSFKLDWVLSFFESVGVFAALYIDRNDALVEVMRSAVAERFISSSGPVLTQLRLNRLYTLENGRGYLGYVGMEGSVVPIASLTARATVVMGMGNFLIDLSEAEHFESSLSGYAADLELHYGLGEMIDLGVFAFSLSGSEPPQSNDASYDAFIGVAPYWVWTALFFSGGINQGFSARRAASAGINGHGVYGGGPCFEIGNELIEVEMRLALLRAFVEPQPNLGRDGLTYGVEADLFLDLSLTDWLILSTEVDLFVPGRFLPDSQLAYRAITRLSVSYAN